MCLNMHVDMLTCIIVFIYVYIHIHIYIYVIMDIIKDILYIIYIYNIHETSWFT